MNQSVVESISCEKPFTDHLKKKDLYTETIKVWDYLCENGYSPADFSQGEITMRRHGFKKLVKENANQALTKETRHYRLSSVYIGNIEVSFMEVKSDDQNGWMIENNWEPLR